MAGNALGALRTAARKAGLDLDDYDAFRASGLKRCTSCKEWRETIEFDIDRSRADGFTAGCRNCRRVTERMVRVLSAPSTKVHNAATNAVRIAIRRGVLSPPATMACVDCGVAAEQYHHWLGYEQEHWLNVIALCRSCHQKRHWEAPNANEN